MLLFNINNLDLKDFLIYIIVLIVLTIFVMVPSIIYYRNNRQLLQQQEIWKNLSRKVGELTLDHIQGLPDPTRFVLSCVLTNRPGIGKSQAIPIALEHLGAALDAPLRALRSCSYLAVLLGLLGTVMFLTLTFWGVENIQRIRPEMLSHIYFVNFLAISFASFLYVSYTYFRQAADQLVLTASQTLGRLHTDVPEGVDPNLVAALKQVAQQFTQWSEDIYARHQRESRELVQEMQNLGQALREMVQGMVAAQRTEVEGIIPLLRSQDEKIELLSQRLDERFRDLARPLLEALPLLEAWRDRTAELKQAVEEMLRADLEGNAAALARATAGLGTAVTDLPQAAREQFRGVKKELSAGLGQALRQSFREDMLPAFQDLHASLTALTDWQQTLQGAMGRLPEEVAARSAQQLQSFWSEAMEPTVRALATYQEQIREVLQTVHHTVEQLPDTIKQAMAMAFLPLTQLQTDSTNQLRDLLNHLERLQEFPQTLPAALQESLRGLITNLSTAVSQAFHQLCQQLRAAEDICRDTFPSLLAIHQKQVEHLEKLTTLLPSTLEALGTQLAHRITQTMHQPMEGTSDGYLRDILTVLEELRADIKNVQQETTASQGKNWWIFWKR